MAGDMKCVPLIYRWSLTLKTLHSLCKCSAGIVCVQPVIIGASESTICADEARVISVVVGPYNQ